ncbi:unnamed protein product [Adineta steineri]|uniref:Uncharacterized protein n=1 Tax=Adineta steineri TaxID=433720 RepID=A0A816EA33_9BILA|nr:unnamed protein product [Adineta steineri]CAF1647170.1 unnamed protein product [Adineta steineri]
MSQLATTNSAKYISSINLYSTIWQWQITKHYVLHVTKKKITYLCDGCSKKFCLIHLTEHQENLNKELKCLINDCDEFKDKLNKLKQNRQYPQNQTLIKQINEWEKNSIEKIKEKAEDCRKIVIESSETFLINIEMIFIDLTEQIKQIQKENEYNEINLNYLKDQLIQIKQKLNSSSNISVQEDSQSFINDISIISSEKPKLNKWRQNAITVAGGTGLGQKLDQLNLPAGISIDKNKNIFIANFYNHRIVEWKYNAKERQTIAGGNGKGNRMDQLDRPTDVIVDQQTHLIIIADRDNRRVIRWINQNQQVLIGNIDCCIFSIDKHGFLYLSNAWTNEVRRWKMGEYNNEGIIVAGGNGEGDQLNQFHYPTFMFVDEDQSIYVTDQRNHRVMKWRKDAKEGRIVAGGNGKGRNLNQLSCPAGVIVDDLGQIYVTDSHNHRVMRWCEGEKKGETIVGGHGKGSQSNQLYYPYSLSFDNEGNLYVVDFSEHRIKKFEIIL